MVKSVPVNDYKPPSEKELRARADLEFKRQYSFLKDPRRPMARELCSKWEHEYMGDFRHSSKEKGIINATPSSFKGRRSGSVYSKKK